MTHIFIRITRKAATLALAVALCTATAKPARADANSNKAHELYDQGVTEYNLAHFKEALTAFEGAYRLRHDSAFLFNIGQCQRNLHHYEDAELSFKAYLRESPALPPATRTKIQGLIAEMERAGRDRSTPAAEPAAVTPAVQPATPPQPTTPQQPALVVTSAVPQPRRDWYRNPAGWSLVGGGVVLVVVSAALLAVAAGEGNSAERAATQASFDSHHSRDLQLQQAGFPLLGVGAAAAVSGAIVLTLGARRRR
jgi:tetratricopeptide (TPR) repeat protein